MRHLEPRRRKMAMFQLMHIVSSRREQIRRWAAGLSFLFEFVAHHNRLGLFLFSLSLTPDEPEHRRGTPARTPALAGWPCRELPGVVRGLQKQTMTGLMERFHLITLKETSPEMPKPTSKQNETSPYSELMQTCLANDFLKRFEIDDRVVVSHIFHHWAKKQAFYFPKRLLDKPRSMCTCCQ